MKLTTIIPKLPMKDKPISLAYYQDQLSFELLADYGSYCLLKRDEIELHLFTFEQLNVLENYGMLYIRVENIDRLYQYWLDSKVIIHPNGALEVKPWGQKEFSLLDPAHNCLTFGEAVER